MTRKEAVRRIEQAAEKKLKELNLFRLGLEELPLEIVECTHLTELYFSGNEITSIPEALGQLSNLKGLLLLNNQIAEIPEAIRSMKNLEELDLRGNPVPIPPQVLGRGQGYGGWGGGLAAKPVTNARPQWCW